MIISDAWNSHREPRAAPRRRAVLAGAAVCYLLFVVYGSLVPLDYHPMPLQYAWRTFLRTRYLELGVGARADWIANILLYIPLACLWCALLAGRLRSIAAKLVAVVFVYAFCVAVAIGVEFAQLFFPPRTVSLNDIVAEFIGSALGILIWLVWGRAFATLWSEIERGGLPAIRTAVVVYVLAYVALSMFPYDFLVSAQEYAEKFAGNSYSFIVTTNTCADATTCAGKLLAEVIAVIPLGVLLGMALGRAARHPYRIAVATGLVLGVVIEVGQVFLASGVSDGVSALTRALGVALGVFAHRHVDLHNVNALRPYVGRVLVVLTPPYLLALAWANAWFIGRWLDVAEARAKLYGVHWLPFYYHYYTSETHALKSLLVTIAMYVPVGFGYWLWTLSPRRAREGANALVPALFAAVLAAVAEMGKLFVPGKHPDPTDILIAIVAAGFGYGLATRMHQWALQGAPAAEPAAASAEAAQIGAARAWPALLLLAGAAVALSNHPLGGMRLGAAFAVYAVALWRRPGPALAAVLALLPLGDLSPWSGWVLVNEFDVLVAVTLAVWLLRRRAEHPRFATAPGAAFVVVLLAASFFTSAVIGLLPLSAFDANALGSQYTSYSSLRQLKGFAWALALLPLVADEWRDPPRMERRWCTGMLVGLCAVVAIIVWQRMTYAGLWNFDVVYRVEGPFPELHTGGGDVHAYLVMAIPFVAAWTMLRPTTLRLVAGAALFMAASYALGVTFTRGGYVGYAGVLAVLGVAALLRWLPRDALRLRRLVVTAVLALGGIAMLVPIMTGSFMEARIAATKAEAATRAEHWSRAIRAIDAGAPATLFGMGLGTFPRTALFKNPEAASATFSFARERRNGFVRLGSGRPLYLDQRVPVLSGKRYTLSLDLRSAQPGAKLVVFLCEKSIQYSFRCTTASVAVERAGAGWEHHELMLASDEIGSGPWLLQRPVALSLENGQVATIVDVDNVRLVDDSGANLVVNGDFSSGGARWLFAADDHLPWHIFNLWVQILFEQGWLGVLAVGVAVAVVLGRLGGATWRGEPFAAALLAALVGFLLVGLTESLFDGPRVTTLFFLVVFAGLLHPRSARRVAELRAGAHAAARSDPRRGVAES